MKMRINWWIIPATVLSLAACGKKEEVKAPDAPAPAENTVVSETPAPAPAPAPEPTGSALSAGERAAKLGFVKHLPQETEIVIAFHNGSKAASRVKSSKLWSLVEDQMGMGMMPGAAPDIEFGEEDFEIEEVEQDTALEEIDEDAEIVEASGPAALFGQEFTMAFGKSTGQQSSNLLNLYSRMGYFQMRTLAQAFAEAAKSGDFSAMEDAMTEQYGPGLAKDLLADPESGIALFEKMNMPPVYLAFRTDSAGRAAAAQQLASLVENLGMLGEMVEPVEVERAGQTFAGQKVSGKQVSASMAEEREDMEEMLEPATVDKIIAAVAGKDLVVLSGTLGEYAILFIGSSVDELQFADDIASSMVATDALAFSDAYADKELAAVVYGQEESISSMIQSIGGLAEMAGGIRDGLAGSDGLGDTRDLETLLRMVVEREKALLKMTRNETLGTVAFFEEGLKVESFGGLDKGAVDWKSPNRLAPLGDADDVVLFANMTGNAEYDQQVREYLEAITETAYALMTKVSESPIENGDMAEFKEMTKIFDTKFRTDLVALWDAFSKDFGSGLGQEGALVIDLGGSVPPIPGIPQPVVDEAKFPRISMICPVTDRAKLASSWQQMNTSVTSILAKVSEMAGEDIPMQKPISSDTDGYTSWFFSMPFFNDDFVPSVTVGDKWFVASTSKNKALDLVNKADQGGATREGLWFAVDFKALQTFARETQKVVEKNSDAIFGDDGMPEEMEMLSKLIDAMDDLDRLTVHTRREGGELRSSMHFKTR